MSEPAPGDMVCVSYGRWAGRVGILKGHHVSYGGQMRLYPIVALHARGRAKARTVRVVRIESYGPTHTPADPGADECADDAAGEWLADVADNGDLA